MAGEVGPGRGCGDGARASPCLLCTRSVALGDGLGSAYLSSARLRRLAAPARGSVALSAFDSATLGAVARFAEPAAASRCLSGATFDGCGADAYVWRCGAALESRGDGVVGLSAEGPRDAGPGGRSVGGLPRCTRRSSAGGGASDTDSPPLMHSSGSSATAWTDGTHTWAHRVSKGGPARCGPDGWQANHTRTELDESPLRDNVAEADGADVLGR